jgi:hypothetical protein
MSDKNAKKLAASTGLPVVMVMVRGGTSHRKDLCLEDGSIRCLWPDGSITGHGSRWRAPTNQPQ